MLRLDLAAAKIPYQDSGGRVADFHSLRHTFISNLSRSGVSPKVAQSLARHSTIGLTMDTYTHIGLYDERAALDSLPRLQRLDDDSGGSSTAVRTGTDDLPVNTDKCAYKPAYKKLTKNADSGFNRSSLIGIDQGEKGRLVRRRKSLEPRMLDTESDSTSPFDTSKNKRRRPDSNRRITVLQTVALDHLATPPPKKSPLDYT